MLQDDQLQQAAAGGGRGKQGAAAKAAARAVAELGGDDGIEDYVGGDEYDDVHGLGGSDDDEAGVAGPASSRRKAAVAAARDSAFLEGPAPVYRKGQALNQLDPEVIAKTRERIAFAEAEAAKRVERQEAAGGAPRHHRRSGAGGGSDGENDDDDTGLAGEVGDLFNEQLPQVFVEREDRWDCESVLSLRSNLENHPARIAEPQRCAGGRGGGAIKLSNKTGIPLAAVVEGDVPAPASSSGSDEGHLEDDFELLLLERRKDETPEEKRVRKAAVKEAQRDARASKKALRTMFREEGTKQRRQAAGRALGAPTGGSTFVIA